MDDAELTEFENASAQILYFGQVGLLYLTEPFYGDNWQPSDSRVRWGWRRLKLDTECEAWTKRGKRGRRTRG